MSKIIVGGDNFYTKELKIPNTVLRVVEGDNCIPFLVFDPCSYYDWKRKIFVEKPKLIEHECKVIPGLKMLDCRGFSFSSSKSLHTEEDHCIFIILSETIEGDKQFLHTIHYRRMFDKYTDPRDLCGSTQDGEYDYCSEISEYPISGEIYVIDENHICYFDNEQNLRIIKMNFDQREIEGRWPGKLYDVFSIQNIALKDFEFKDEIKQTLEKYLADTTDISLSSIGEGLKPFDDSKPRQK